MAVSLAVSTQYTNVTDIHRTTALKPEVVIAGSSYIFYCRRLLKNYSEQVVHSLLNYFVFHNRHRHTVHFIMPTHMNRNSCRPDVVKYIMAALKPEVVCISSTTTCTTFSVLLHMFYNHIIYFILPIMPNNSKRTSIWRLYRK